MKQIRLKLESMGFTKIYENHPVLEIRQFDFIKNGVRLQCFVDQNKPPYFKINYEVVDERFIYSVVGTFIFDFDKAILAHAYFVNKKKPGLFKILTRWCNIIWMVVIK